jgi:hypothetical protein
MKTPGDHRQNALFRIVHYGCGKESDSQGDLGGRQSPDYASLTGMTLEIVRPEGTRSEPPPQQTAEMPLPSDAKVFFLGGLFALALLTMAYVAAEVVLPLVLAFTLKLLLQPVMRILERFRVPRAFAALLLIPVLCGTIVGLATAISGPAGTWAAKLPEGSSA